MKPFLLTLSNGAQLSGLCSLPTPTPVTPPHVPLLVGLHGGTYSSQYFDALPSTSVDPISSALGIPFIAVDRPGYKKSSALPDVPSESTFLREEGKYLHRYILPKLWEEYGKRCGCTAMVLVTHSLGSPGAIIAAAIHAGDDQRDYPFGGLIMSGWGVKPLLPREEADKIMAMKQPRLKFPSNEIKDFLMFGPKEAGRVEAKMFDMTETLGTAMSYGEFEDANATWLDYWEAYARKVKAPIMYGLAEHDGLWAGKEEYVQEFAKAFTGSARVERGLILGAPHCGELSYWARGWYLRCFGFAAECATAEAIGESR